MTNSSFEQRWRQRFTQRGSQCDDDAAIAGWTPTGLASRVRQFQSLWHQARPEGTRWLDIGCGAGTYTRLLQAEGRSPIGLDYSAPSLHKARQRSPASIDWLAADVHHLPFADGEFDGVLCFGVMQALADSRPALAEMHRVLRPGGEIWVDALNARTWPTVLQERRRVRAGKAPHLRYEATDSLQAAARAAGLQPLACYWLPLVPGRLHGLQGPAESRWARALWQASPWIAERLCHSFILRTRKGQM
ncbi:class I SAM-dependent methyltransferase [Thioalkalivibrio sp. ALgr1]|uniref:class I SAM-dependent methyltransferase n=1 Tax=Thioalkalivibrio sp. ALgr1 TaxID=748655 RepID=UPI00036E8532|nr:class I SAM-dependent methyltransferase [Thioalkalivibrio sp. ALgr1]